MGPKLNVTIIDTIERGFERTIVYSDGTMRMQVWSRESCTWMFVN